MSPIEVLVVGAGARGVALAKAWAKVEGARVVGVADPDLTRAEALAVELGAEQIEADYRVAVPATSAQVVVAATPAFLHRPVTELAAAHGKHVLSEKPIALNLDDADSILAAVAKAGVVYGVCHQLRHGAVYRKAKELILDGAIGRPLQIRSNYALEVRPKILMHSRAGNGGPVIDFICHRFDWWRNLLGAEPSKIYGRGFVLGDDKPELAAIRDFAIDTASFVVEFTSGDIWGCNVSWGLPPGLQGPNLDDVLGRDGWMNIGMNSISMVRRGGKKEEIDGLQTDLDLAVADNFAHCVREGRQPLVTGAAAKEALRGSLAVLASVETGEIQRMGDRRAEGTSEDG